MPIEPILCSRESGSPDWIPAFAGIREARRQVSISTALAALALLAACGQEKDLRPAEGASLPPKAATAAAQPGPADLLTPSPEAKPQRSDESLKKSEERRDDRFDLPPPG